MSAWVVSHAHIDAILTWAVDKRVYIFLASEHGRYSQVTERNADEIGRILLTENVRSVEHRYPSDEPDNLPGTIGETVKGYSYLRWWPFKTRALTPVEVMKAIDCLEYQSNEHDEWEESQAHRICQDIRSAAVSALPGWDKAPWGFDRSRAYA